MKTPQTPTSRCLHPICSLSSWTVDDLALAIEFARLRGGDCTLMILYVATQIIEHENRPPQ